MAHLERFMYFGLIVILLSVLAGCGSNAPVAGPPDDNTKAEILTYIRTKILTDEKAKIEEVQWFDVVVNANDVSISIATYDADGFSEGPADVKKYAKGERIAYRFQFYIETYKPPMPLSFYGQGVTNKEGRLFGDLAFFIDAGGGISDHQAGATVVDVYVSPAELPE